MSNTDKQNKGEKLIFSEIGQRQIKKLFEDHKGDALPLSLKICEMSQGACITTLLIAIASILDGYSEEVEKRYEADMTMPAVAEFMRLTREYRHFVLSKAQGTA